MRARYAYSAVLVLIASAWLAGHVFKPGDRSSSPSTETEPDPLATDPARLGIADNRWRPGGKCNIERLNGAPFGNEIPTIRAKSPVRISGWALDPAKSRMPRSLLLQFTGEGGIRFFAEPDGRFPRDDVTDYFKLPRTAAPSGFEFQSKGLNLPVGEYAVRLVLSFEDATYTCDMGRRIRVAS